MRATQIIGLVLLLGTPLGRAGAWAQTRPPAGRRPPEEQAQERTGPVEPIEISTVVTYLAGDYVYLDKGRDAGILSGDSLGVSRAGLRVGRLLVAGTAADRAVTRFLGEPFAVAVGDSLVIRLPARDRPAQPRQEIQPPDRESLLSEDVSRSPARSRATPSVSTSSLRVSGRFRADVNGSRTMTKWASIGTETITRTYMSPSVSGRVLVSGLPAGLSAVTDFRWTQYGGASSLVEPTSQIRIYQASLSSSPRQRGLHYQVGRFQLSTDPGRGFWDGARVGYAMGAVEGGVAVGLEPDRFDGVFQTGVPKVGLSLSAHHRAGAFRWSGLISGVAVRPSIDWADRTTLGLEQEIRYGQSRIGLDWNLDRDPEFGGWSGSRLGVQVSTPVARGLQVWGRYRATRRVAYWRTADVVGPLRVQQSVGLNWQVGRADFRASWTGTSAQASFRGDAIALSGGFRRLPFIRTDLTASAGHWSGGGSTTDYLGGGLSRRLFGIQARASYQLYRFSRSPITSVSHSMVGSVSIPLVDRLTLLLQGRLRLGKETSGSSGYVSLNYRF